jgi:hypothetical protein
MNEGAEWCSPEWLVEATLFSRSLAAEKFL